MFKNNNLLIEVGSKTIKIIKLKSGKSNDCIEDYRIIDMDDTLLDYDDIPNSELLSPIISTVLAEMDIKGGKVRLVLGSHKIVSRVREIPPVSVKEMKDMILMESDQFLPYSSNEFYIDYRILGETQREENVNLFKAFITAVPKVIIDAYINMFSKLKLRVKTINVSTDTTHLFIEKHLVGEDKNIIIADMGYELMKMIVYKGCDYFVSLNANRGVKNILTSIEAEKGLNEKDALIYLTNTLKNPSSIPDKIQLDEKIDDPTKDKINDLKKRLNLLKNKQNQKELYNKSLDISKAVNPDLTIIKEKNSNLIIEEFFNNYSLELRRMVDFFKSREFGAIVHEIYLIGGGASINGIEAYLNDLFEIPIKVVDSSIYFEMDFIKDEDKQMFIPALGSLLGGGR